MLASGSRNGFAHLLISNLSELLTAWEKGIVEDTSHISRMTLEGIMYHMFLGRSGGLRWYSHV